MTSLTASKPQTFQSFPFPLKIFHGVVLIDIVSLQEAIDFVAGFKAKQAAQIRLMEMTQPVFFRQQGLQGAAGEIVIHAAAKPLGDVVGNVDREFHALYLTFRRFRRQPIYFAGSAAPSRISSVARRTTRSPGSRLPITSMLSPSAAPFFTSTHSALPWLARTTKQRSAVVTTLVLGTSSEGRVRRMGHFTLGYMPGESEPSRLRTSNSTGMVRVFASRACATRATAPA